MIALLLAAASPERMPYLYGDPQREIAPYIACLIASGMVHVDKITRVEDRNAAAAQAKAACAGRRAKAIADVQREGDLVHLPVTPARASALADGIDRAIDRVAKDAPSLSAEAVFDILNEESRRAFNQ